MQGAGGVGGLVAINIAHNGVHFPAYDGNGNVSGLVKGSDGTISAQYEYGPFGEAIRASGAVAAANPCRFSTKWTDDESDFLYYSLRYFIPNTGRWPNQDPLGEKGFEVMRHRRKPNFLGDDPNLYAFVRNNPSNRPDYLGLSGGDVMLLWQIFEAIVDEYCTKGIRCNCPTLGNVYASVPFLSNRGCTWQAINTDKILLDAFLPHTDAKWSLDTPSSGIIFRHNWVTAESDDHNDPKVELDTWKGCITIKYAADAPIQQCYHCDPLGRHFPQQTTHNRPPIDGTPTWPNEGIN
jgi:RHS repeat-associated protein